LEQRNKGIMPYLDEIERYTGKKAGNVSFFGDFIMNRMIYREFLHHWRKTFEYFFNKYGESFLFQSDDPWRTPFFFYDAIAVHYFSTRNDLKIVEFQVYNLEKYG